jgi:8-oxo-dGTP diphosphatase
MKQIAAIIFENQKGELLLCKRDNSPGIPFPLHWDLPGGHVEDGETPEEALVREVREELGYELKEYSFFKKYECQEGDAYPNVKYIYSGKLNIPAEKITLYEGDHAEYFNESKALKLKFANIVGSIVRDYFRSRLMH